MRQVIILWSGSLLGLVRLKVLVLLRSLPNFMVTDEIGVGFVESS
jgi:hypothetical protein